MCVTWLGGERLIGDDDEATTDGSHPSDLGAMRDAQTVGGVLAAMLPSAAPGGPSLEPTAPGEAAD